MSAGIAILQASGEQVIERCARNYSQLTESRYRLRQPPTGYAGAHSALNDDWMFAHSMYKYYIAEGLAHQHIATGNCDSAPFS